MSLNTLRSYIEGRIATEFAASPALQVAYENVPFTPPNNASWLQTSILWGDSAYATLLKLNTANGGRDQRNGVLTFNIFTPRGEGPGAGLVIAQRCIDLFSRLTLQSIIFDAANGPRTIEAAAPPGFFQTQVTISFSAFEES